MLFKYQNIKIKVKLKYQNFLTDKNKKYIKLVENIKKLNSSYRTQL